jgi:hypothetical protein
MLFCFWILSGRSDEFSCGRGFHAFPVSRSRQKLTLSETSLEQQQGDFLPIVMA